MNIIEAKELVIKAGLKLVESGLIARTWGNISCRIDENSFLITPSGRDYISLTTDEIVFVNISDCSYEGNVKPSSEKGIHADVYKMFPEINFIIHTHQENASIIGATGLDSIKLKDNNPYLGDEVLCAPYSLPGTKSLCRKVSKTLSNSKGKAVIMKNHGAICIGKDYDEAFAIASELETACDDFISAKHLELGDEYEFNNKTKDEDFISFPNSERTEDGLVLYYNDGQEIELKFNEINESSTMETKTYKFIYKIHKDIDYILFKSTSAINKISSLSIPLRPLLDDFAQIVGTVAKNAKNTPVDITAALKNSSAVFIQNSGALCCGQTKDDAIATGMILEKGSKAYLAASLFGKVKPINTIESLLMRFVYLRKYSKQKDKKA